MRSARGVFWAGATGALVAAGAAWIGWFEPRRLVVRRLSLTPTAWPAHLDGLRLAVVSDLHTGGPHVDERRVESVVRAVDHERPDLIALLGDFVDPAIAFGQAVSPEAVAGRLAGLRAPLGVYAVLGNHDWRNAGRDMGRALSDRGIKVLENDAARTPGEPELWIMGLADANERRPDVQRALADVPSDATVICLTHDPDLFPDIPEHVSLTLAGHTHGGQVAIPWLRRLVMRSDHGDRYASGHVVEGGRQLFVTVGVGESGYPIRFLAPPEVVILTLRSG